MDPLMLVQAWPRRSGYSAVTSFVSRGAETAILHQVVRFLSVETDIQQRRLEKILKKAPNPQLGRHRLFFLACSLGNLPLVEFLLPTYDIDSVNEQGKTALVLSAERGEAEIVRFLVDQGASPLTNGSYAPLVSGAVSSGNPTIVELVLQLAGVQEDVSEILGDNESLLAKAVENDEVEYAALLLAYGGSVLATSHAESKTLLESIQSVEMAELLYSHGADFSGIAGVDAVVEAICQDNTPLVEFFLSHGVDIRQVQYRTASPLHCACIHRKIDLIELLAAQCIDLDARLEDGSTALQKCFLGGEIAKRTHQLLVHLGADVNARSNAGADSRYREPSRWIEPDASEQLWQSKEDMRSNQPFGGTANAEDHHDENDAAHASEVA